MDKVDFRLQHKYNVVLQGYADSHGYNKSALLRQATKEYLKNREVI